MAKHIRVSLNVPCYCKLYVPGFQQYILIDNLLSVVQYRTNSSFELGLGGCVTIVWLRVVQLYLAVIKDAQKPCSRAYMHLLTTSSCTTMQLDTACWFFNRWCLLLDTRLFIGLQYVGIHESHHSSITKFHWWIWISTCTLRICINQPCSRKVI